ncbi:MAG TPA: tetratricopeptide repeat protein [Caldisericia bacterium]|nr:tetratricopeptide repeat protein [Caldisericia bacterium]HPO29094.1 tetratricopeptide repeat protein [Caldisericia bacterium]HQG82094.1 tetratricopeptide repeat protein [Caldisericia bacterium]HXK69982.1 tetratricopeptide repeat protein [Caldisericia bacterium]
MNINDLLEEAKRNESIGKIDEAIIALEKALLLSPLNKEILLTLSRLYIGKGKILKVLELISGIENLKNDPDILMQEANIYMLLHRFEEAEAKLKEALQFKESSSIYNNLGVVLLQQRKGNEAIQALKKSIKIDPKNINTWLNLATFYESAGDLDSAKDTLERAFSMSLKNEELIEKYVQILSKKGEYESAISLIDDELANNKENLPLRLTKVKVLFFKGLTEDCIEEINNIEKENILSPQNKKELMEIKEQAYYSLGYNEKALEVLDELINISNGNPYYLFRKAQIFYSLQNYTESLKICSMLLKEKTLNEELRSNIIILMKNIEIENWKRLVRLLIEEPAMKDALLNDLIFTIQSTGILLPEEGLIYLQSILKQITSKYGKFRNTSPESIS